MGAIEIMMLINQYFPDVKDINQYSNHQHTQAYTVSQFSILPFPSFDNNLQDT